MNKLQCFYRTAGDTGLLTIGASLPAPVGRVQAEIAFHGYVFTGVPNRSMGPLGAGLDACSATDTLFRIDDPDIAIRTIHMTGAGGAVLHTKRCYALSAYGHCNVIGIFCKRGCIADDLNSRKRRACHSLMGERTCIHATLAAETQPAVVYDIAG